MAVLAENSILAIWPKLANNSETVLAVISPKITAVITAENCFGHTLSQTLILMTWIKQEGNDLYWPVAIY